VDEHDVFGEDGIFIMKIGEQELRWIAGNNNAQVKETGDEVPVTLGHTTDDAPESEQPPVVGYCRDFYVAPLVNAKTGEASGRKAIYARTMTFTEEDVEKFDLKRFNRRSVELWIDDKSPAIIDPVALLSSTTPERPLGLLRLSRNGGRRLQAAPTAADSLLAEATSLVEEQPPARRLPPVRVKRSRFGSVTNYPSDQDDLVARILAELMASEPMKFLSDLQNDPGMMEAYLARHLPQPGLDMMPVEEEDLDMNQVPDVLDETEGPMAPPAPPARSQRRRPVRRQMEEEGGESADDFGSTLNGGGDMSVNMNRNGNTHAPRKPQRNERLVRIGPSGTPEAGVQEPECVRYARDDDDAPHGEMPAGGDELDMVGDEFASEDNLEDMVDDIEEDQDVEEMELGEEIGEEVADAAVEAEMGHHHHCPHCGGSLGVVEDEIDDEMAAAMAAEGDGYEQEEVAEEIEDEAEMEHEVAAELEDEADGPVRNAAQPHEVGGNPEHPRGSMFRTPGGRLPTAPPRAAAAGDNYVRGHNKDTVTMAPLEAAYAASGPRPGEGRPRPMQHAREGEQVQRKKLHQPGGEMHPGAAKIGMQKPMRKSMGGSTASATNTFTAAGSKGAVNGRKDPAEGDVNQYQNPTRLKSPEQVETLSRRKVKRMRTATAVNTQPQGALSPAEVENLLNELDVQRRENATLRARQQKLEQTTTVLVRHAKSIAQRERIARRESDLKEMMVEGYEIDLNEEMGEPGTGDAYIMPDAQWQGKIRLARKRYSKSIATGTVPMHPAMLRSGEPVTAGAKPMTREDMWANVRQAQAAGDNVAAQKEAYRKAVS
jgi:hypothetical protein